MVERVAVSRDNKYVVSSCNDSVVTIWDSKLQEQVHNFGRQAACTYSLVFTPDSNLLIRGFGDGKIKIWNIREKTDEVLESHTKSVFSLCLSENERYLGSGSDDYTIKIWNFKERKLEFTLKGHTKCVYAVALTSDNQYIISGSADCTIAVWNLKEQRQEFMWKGHSDTVNSITITSDGKRIISGSKDRTIKVWNMHGENMQTENNLEISEFTTADRKYTMKVRERSIASPLCIHSNETNDKIQSVGPQTLLDPYYQELIKFYNVIDACTSEDYSKLSPSVSRIIFSRYKYTITHVMCVLGKDSELKKVLGPEWSIQCDVFERSPFYYAIASKNQKCVDTLIDHLVFLSENAKTLFISSSFSIRNDFKMIIGQFVKEASSAP